MGQRYEKNKKNVSENKKTLEKLHTDKETLRNEYAPLSLLESIQGILDDEASDAIQGVRAVGEVESQRLETETDTAEDEKKQITEDINSEIAKLNAGLEKLRRAGNIEFGKKAIEQSSQEYKKQIDKFKSLMGELGVSVSDSSSSGATVSEVGGQSFETPQESGIENSIDNKDASIVGFVFNSIMSPRNEDVKKWTSYLDSISNTVRRQYSERHGQYITPGKLDVPLSETLVYETQALFESKGIERGVLGYNDGIKSRVAVGTGHELQTTIHENLHQLSANGSAHGIIESDSYSRRNVQMNEAITEMLTQRTLGEQYGPDYSAYSDNRDAMRLIESVMGEDTISQSYFQNRPELMQDKIDTALGQGTWEQLSDAFDDCLSRNQFTRESGRVRRDNIVNRYLMTATTSNGGENGWNEMLL